MQIPDSSLPNDHMEFGQMQGAGFEPAKALSQCGLNALRLTATVSLQTF